MAHGCVRRGKIPGANHMFLAASPADSRRNLEAITYAVTTWLPTFLRTERHLTVVA